MRFFVAVLFVIFSSSFFCCADPIDLDRLFTFPTQQEIEEVYHFFSNRQVVFNDVRVERQKVDFNGNRILLISHLMGRLRHYGVVKIPTHKPSGQKFPVLVHMHGGREGIAFGAKDLKGFKDVVEIFPSFIGEQVRFSVPDWMEEFYKNRYVFRFKKQENFISDGDRFWTSPVQDADCALTFVAAVASIVSELDDSFIIVSGISRGGAGALNMALRDQNVKAVISTSGLTNIFCDQFKEKSRQILPYLGLNLEQLRDLIHDQPFFDFVKNVLKPLHDGVLSMSRARFSMLSRSAVFFANRLPSRIQLHYGELDDIVSVKQGSFMVEALLSNGWSREDIGLFIYPDVGHDFDENELFYLYQDDFIRKALKEYYQRYYS